MRRASQLLELEREYTAKELVPLLGLNQMALYKKIFAPRDFASILLFLTENRNATTTNLLDILKGDELYLLGPVYGEFDQQLIRHRELKLEVVLFYRQQERTNTTFGFRYAGLFAYVSHRSGRANHFLLRRTRSEKHESTTDRSATSNRTIAWRDVTGPATRAQTMRLSQSVTP